MKSRKSFFNRALCLNYLRRCWPLWLVYFAVLVFMLPASLPGVMKNWSDSAPELIRQSVSRYVLGCASGVAVVSFIAGVAAAAAVFGFLYKSKSCSMICSLPLRRECVFFTAFVSGLAPLLISDLLVTLISLAFFGGSPCVNTEYIWIFLAVAVMSNVAFYGFAVFCAMLTGNAAVLTGVYIVLNAAAFVAEQAVMGTLYCFVYGFEIADPKLAALSPIVNIMMTLDYTQKMAPSGSGYVPTGEYEMTGLGTLGIYCAAGLVFALLALLLYRRRRMESAGDAVAIPVLKPIFKYCLSFGTAFCFAAVVYDSILRGLVTGFAAAACIIALLLAGAFIGYFAAEMLMQKTLRVFRGRWKGYIVCAALLAAFTLLFEFDAFGYERRVPDTEDVDEVIIKYAGMTQLREKDSIDAAAGFHRQLIADRDVNEKAAVGQYFRLEYIMKDGSVIKRNYSIADDEAQRRDPDSCINSLAGLINVQEAIDSRVLLKEPLGPENIDYAEIFNWNSEITGGSGQVRLTPEQAADFYRSCVVPDAAEGKMGRIFPVENREYYENLSTLEFSMSLSDGRPEAAVYSDGDYYTHSQYYNFKIYMDARRCIDWIRENTDIVPMSLADIDPEIMEEYNAPGAQETVSTVRAAG
ncbi:MAG: hypothetical protein ACOX68_03760 [Candidatus Limivicinus sp.]